VGDTSTLAMYAIVVNIMIWRMNSFNRCEANRETDLLFREI